jgi:putative spermidine/putrescine transport system ATP-binding protein
VRAVDAVDLDIAPGEFFAMLGPSGSGKTTCLRLIAGFEQPTAGSISIFGERAEGVAALSPQRQHRVSGLCAVPASERARQRRLRADGQGRRQGSSGTRRRKRRCGLVRLPGYGARRPGQLSGGQRQRVALARALVNQPKVLLLDEPLGALDLKLRENMQEELKSLQKALGITFVFVTHDQGEALSMADRVAVFNDGKIMQVGTPEDIYQRPKTRFVADFVGSSNVLLHDIQYQGSATRYELTLENGQTLSISQANNQWIDSSAQHQTGTRLSARWAREAMIPLHDTVASGV